MKSKDTLGDRMKAYEALEARRTFTKSANQPVCIRRAPSEVVELVRLEMPGWIGFTREEYK